MIDTSEPHTGTTIVGCCFDGGVIVGSDGRVSTGTYISNRASCKITPLTENVYLLRSGSAADTQLVADYVRFYANQLQAETGKQLSVATVANLVKQINYGNKGQLMGAMILGGFDDTEGGQVYGCPIGGTLVREPWAIDGSGSTFIWGICDHEYRDGMTQEEAERFVTEALALAMARDSSSGGCIRMVVITKDGSQWKYIPGDKVPQYQDELPPPGLSGGVRL